MVAASLAMGACFLGDVAVVVLGAQKHCASTGLQASEKEFLEGRSEGVENEEEGDEGGKEGDDNREKGDDDGERGDDDGEE